MVPRDDEPRETEAKYSSSPSFSTLNTTHLDESHGRDSPGNNHHHPFPPPDPDLFEFNFSKPSSPPELCAADDIIFDGKLIPSSPASPPETAARPEFHSLRSRSYDFRRAYSLDRHHGCCTHKYSRTLPNAQSRRQSLDQSRDRCIGQLSQRRLSGAGPPPPVPRTRPPWWVLAFGSMRAPEGMEMRHMSSRRTRRGVPPVGPKPVSGPTLRGGKSWSDPTNLLRWLACIEVKRSQNQGSHYDSAT